MIDMDSVPGLLIAFAGLVILSAAPLKLAGVDGMVEPGTGYLGLSVIAFFGLVTMLAGWMVAVKGGRFYD